MRRNEHRSLSTQLIKKAALIGGTHGNELTGITVVRRRNAIEAHQISPQSGEIRPPHGASPNREGLPDPGNLPAPVFPHTFSLSTLIANPEAVAQNRRYIDVDLNRCFENALLASPHRSGYEVQRAHVLNELLGPKGSDTPAMDLIIDLHTTTAGLGPTVIIREDDLFERWLAAYVVHEIPEVKVLSYLAENAAGTNPAPNSDAPGAANTPNDYPYLAEITRSGIEVEVGPVPQGVVRGETVIWTERIVNSCIRGIDLWNDDRTVDIPETLTVYRYREVVDYPRNDAGDVVAFVHPLRQDRDFVPLQEGDPLFLRFDGNVVPYTGVPGRYPVFINEAAYYEKNAAMTLAEKREVPVV